jgi:hypothetical protein
VHETGDHAGERTLHPGNHYDDTSLLEPVLLPDHSVDSSNPNVVESIDCVAHHLCGDGGLLGYRQIRRAGADDKDGPSAWGHLPLLHRNGTGQLVENGPGHAFANGFEHAGLSPRDEQRLPSSHDSLGDLGNLRRRLADPQDDFRKALPPLTMRVEPGEPEILEGCRAKRAKNLVLRASRVDSALAHARDDALEVGLIHGDSL